jgi:hypothetical protein
MASALEYTRENIESLTPYINRRTAVDGTAYDNDVIEIKFTSGNTMYVNVNYDSNLAAMYDVLAVLLDYKKPIDPRLIEELIPMPD